MAGLDVTPRPPAGRPIIGGYGGGGFVVAGVRWHGSILVLADRTIAWPARVADDITLAALAPIVAAGAGILLVGCGARSVPPPRELRDTLAAAGLVLEWMDTGAACRTFNVLQLDDRPVAAALLAVD